MRICMLRNDGPEGFAHCKWDYAIVGKSIDERGSAARSFVQAACTQTVEVEFFSETGQIRAGQRLLDPSEIGTLFNNSPTDVVLEATTLTFVEVALFCKALSGIDSDTKIQ